MNAENFIEQKTQQLIYYTRGFLCNTIHFSELEIFLWDIFEEWVPFSGADQQPSDDTEKVFWHLVNQLKFWSEDKLTHDLFLRSELNSCVEFLEDKACCPIDCVGLRPL